MSSSATGSRHSLHQSAAALQWRPLGTGNWRRNCTASGIDMHSATVHHRVHSLQWLHCCRGRRGLTAVPVAERARHLPVNATCRVRRCKQRRVSDVNPSRRFGQFRHACRCFTVVSVTSVDWALPAGHCLCAVAAERLRSAAPSDGTARPQPSARLPPTALHEASRVLVLNRGAN